METTVWSEHTRSIEDMLVLLEEFVCTDADGVGGVPPEGGDGAMVRVQRQQELV